MGVTGSGVGLTFDCEVLFPANGVNEIENLAQHISLLHFFFVGPCLIDTDDGFQMRLYQRALLNLQVQ
jgi:hypothetical protein